MNEIKIDKELIQDRISEIESEKNYFANEVLLSKGEKKRRAEDRMMTCVIRLHELEWVLSNSNK